MSVELHRSCTIPLNTVKLGKKKAMETGGFTLRNSLHPYKEFVIESLENTFYACPLYDGNNFCYHL